MVHFTAANFWKSLKVLAAVPTPIPSFPGDLTYAESLYAKLGRVWSFEWTKGKTII